MTIAEDIIQHVNNYIERQKKTHRMAQKRLREVDNSNDAVELVQELAVTMNDVHTASKLYGRAFKPALDALWAEMLETKKEAVKIVQREAEEPPVMCVGSHWVKGFPEITEGDMQDGQLFVITYRGIYHLVVAKNKTTLRAFECEYLWEKGDVDIDWHMRIPQIPAGE